jgi:hypothetical protein
LSSKYDLNCCIKTSSVDRCNKGVKKQLRTQLARNKYIVYRDILSVN